MGIRPATPGTIVVLAATVLLILVTVSTPLVKSLYFLKATIDTSVGNTDINDTVKLGTFGYCVGGTCTNAKLGYSLDIAELLGISGSLGGLSNSVLKWITYLLILHPIAAGFGAISVIFGLLAHTRGMAGTTLSTCFASFAATFALLAFIFDLAVFIIAKKRIESSDVGGKAELGNAIWMTLAALILYAISGFFFGCGACIIRKRRREQQVSDSYRPAVDPEYGAKLRAEAVQADYARKEASGAALPNFPEHVPLTAVHAVDYDDGYGHGAYGANGGYEPRQYASQSDISGAGAPPSLISGVGEGYGRRNPAAPGLPVSFTPDTAPASLPPTSPVGAPAVAGVGARLGAEARANRGRATQEDERRLASGAGAGDVQGMYVPEGQYGAQDGYAPPQPHAAYGQMDYSPYGGAYPPYPSTTSPPPLPQQAGASHVQGYSSATPAPPPGGYGAAEKAQAQAQQPPVLPYRPSPSPSAQQQQQQQYYVQNGAAPSAYGDPFARAGETGSIAPTYYTHDQAGQPQGQGTQYHRGSVAGYQHQQQADPYGAPAGFDGSRRY